MTLVDPATGEVVVGHQVMPEMTPAARAALRASILKFGVLVPVAFDQHGNIIDGHNRVEIADELGVSYEHTTHVVRDHEHAVELAATLNLDRRHMDEVTRASIARSLRRDGHSLRAISGALGVSHQTIANDLNGETAADEPLQLSSDLTTATATEELDRTTGTDGKSYPTRDRSLKWTTEALANLLDLYEGGLTRQILAEMHDVSPSQISHLLGQARENRTSDVYTVDNPPRSDDKSRVAVAARRRIVAEMAVANYTSRQIVDRLGISLDGLRRIQADACIEIPADAVMAGTRHHDSNRIVSETVSTLEGAVFGLSLVDHGDVDPAQVAAWAESLRSSIRSLNRFLKELTR